MHNVQPFLHTLSGYLVLSSVTVYATVSTNRPQLDSGNPFYKVGQPGVRRASVVLIDTVERLRNPPDQHVPEATRTRNSLSILVRREITCNEMRSDRASLGEMGGADVSLCNIHASLSATR